MKSIAAFRVEKVELETRLKVVNKELGLLQEKVLVTFDARGITKMTVAGAGMFYLQTSPYPSVKDNSKFLEWLDAHNMGEIARRTVNFQTLRSWVKEQMAKGGALPEESVLSYFMKRDIRVRKA